MSQPGPHSSSACGKACLASHLQEGPCTGKFITSHYPISGEIDTYIALPPGKTMEEVKDGKAKKVLFWCCDVYGPRFINNQLLMDWVASQGFLVLSPDYFYHSQLSLIRDTPGFSLPTWISKWRTTIQDSNGKEIQKTVMVMKEWMEEMKGMFGKEGTTYGIIGYCFGAPYVIDYCGTTEVNAGAIVHPAFLESDEPFTRLKQPLLCSLAEQDAHFPPPRRNALLDAMTAISTPKAPGGDSSDHSGEGGFDFMVNVYGGVKHGWALRGDMNDKRVKWAREHSAESVKDWFTRFL